MKINLIQIATVVLITGTAMAQTGQPLSSTTSSTSPVKAAPVQINPKTKSRTASAGPPATTPDKSKASSTQSAAPPSATAVRPMLTVKPAASQPTAKATSTKTASATQKPANGASVKPVITSTKPATVTVQGGKAVAVQPAKAAVKATTAGTQASAKTSVTQAASKNGNATTQKPAIGVTAQKPAPKASAAKTSVAQKPVTPASDMKLRTRPGRAFAVKPVKPSTQATAAKAKISAVEQPVKAAAAPPEQAAAPAPRRIERAGRRDPFVSPIHQTGTGPAGTCATGKRCLDVEQVVLKGIVMTREGNMALVENGSRRPYVLRENDALFNGTVEKITGDSIFFRQNVQDVLGHPSTREVIKRVTAPAV